MVGVPGDEPIRSDETHPINRMFADVAQDEPEVHAEPGFEDEVAAFSLFAYLSRSDVTWNPSVVTQCKASLYCPTTEEYILPVIHGNDRVEWFVQLSDEIQWDIEDRDTGAKRARVICKAGDVAAMPADIRHQGYSPKRSMLLVWENASNRIPEMIAKGDTPLCVGIESGTATGWPFTDWVEELILREQGIDFYNQWVAHEVPFNDPKVVETFNEIAGPDGMWTKQGAVFAVGGSIAATTAARSPPRAASVTITPVRASGSPPHSAESWAAWAPPCATTARASLTSAVPEAYISQHPRLPHPHRCP